MIVSKRFLTLSFFIFGYFLVLSSASQASDEYRVFKKTDAYRYVKVVSGTDLSNGVIVPVRRARLGDQVYVPEHGWAYCEFTCAVTVRRLYLDFWEDQVERGGAVSTGIAIDLLSKGYTERDVEQYEREKYLGSHGYRKYYD
ncbi:MAG: hypothetical protein AAF228_09010 [Pseudomonadota bacterium]